MTGFATRGLQVIITVNGVIYGNTGQQQLAWCMVCDSAACCTFEKNKKW